MQERDLTQKTEYLWEIPPTGKMRVPGRLYATRRLLDRILADNAPTQVANVATLPGIVSASLAMPDMHWGYGFPIGGVAAFDIDQGVVSPGGVGYDINCGVRLMASELTEDAVKPHIQDLVNRMFAQIPCGVGAGRGIKLSAAELADVATSGARWAVARDLGDAGDLTFIEENGCIPGADPDQVSKHATQRGTDQIGTLGSGNHFLEIGCVERIYDPTAAAVLGLFPGQVTVIIHCGSRGYGHQICDDYLPRMDRAARAYGIELPDRQLACAPLTSSEGQAYLGAMRCAVNYSFANRQVIAHQLRQVFAATLNLQADRIGLRTVYEVAHNIAKIETHQVDGVERRLCVHRKGATRAFAGQRDEVPPPYRAIGQPVLIPGDMGRYSYVLTGTAHALQETFGSTCHGAGRALSRRGAIKAAGKRNIVAELAKQGILVKSAGRRTVQEEMSEAYKDVTDVVDACEQAGISTKVARLRPLACVKG